MGASRLLLLVGVIRAPCCPPHGSGSGGGGGGELFAFFFAFVLWRISCSSLCFHVVQKTESCRLFSSGPLSEEREAKGRCVTLCVRCSSVRSMFRIGECERVVGATSVGIDLCGGIALFSCVLGEPPGVYSRSSKQKR